jgi:DNA-binding NarL/FixJ family response regulator
VILFGFPTYNLAWDDLVKTYVADPEKVGVMLLCSMTDKQHVQAALKAGFRGVFLKESSLEELRSAIREISKGEIWCDKALTSYLLESLLDPSRVQRNLHDPLYRLSDRQRRIVGLVLEGLSNHQIALQILVSQATVAYELTRIYRELDISDRVQLLLKVQSKKGTLALR